MNIFYTVKDLVKGLPDLVVLLVCPALLLLIGLLLAIFGKKKVYVPFAIALGGAGFFLVYCKDATTGLAYAGLFAVWAVIVSALLLIPFGGKKREGDVQEELYEKFGLSLDIPEEAEEETEEPEEAPFLREESGMRLSHATELLERLKKSELTASDRLEADALSRTLDGYRDKVLSGEEMRALNDCLATILKLTAKYKL